MRKARKEYYLDFLEPKMDKHSKFLFSHIKKLKQDSLGIESLKVNGKTITDAKEKVKEYKKVNKNSNIGKL